MDNKNVIAQPPLIRAIPIPDRRRDSSRRLAVEMAAAQVAHHLTQLRIAREALERLLAHE